MEVFCLECGNCRQNAGMYFCPAKNEFVVTATQVVKERVSDERWRKGAPHYEQHRRQLRKDRLPQTI
jgi:hypothetical protein